MKCISLWQPWATLLVLGPKKFESRSWKLPEKLIGQRIAIHASKKRTPYQQELCVTEPFRAALIATGYLGIADLPFGAIVGSVIFSEPWNTTHPKFLAMLGNMPSCELAFGDFSPGRWAWPVTKCHQLKVPIPFKGAQGFFNLPEEIEDAF
jgi:hypothetical protein